MPPPTATATQATDYLSTPLLILMSIACGLCAGGNYFNQPLLHSIAIGLNIQDSTAALSVTVAQVSYALGLLFIVPLGDKLERRKLVVSLMLMAAIGQFISGFSTGISMLLTGTAVAGLFSVATQILVPMAATFSHPSRSGRAVGLMMSGLLTGILLARSVAGLLSGLGGWTTVYWVSGLIMLVIAWLLWRKLPEFRHPTPPPYSRVLSSMLTLIRQHPRLRSRTLLGALSFACVSVLYSTMALLLAGPVYEMSDVTIGLIGLFGIASALMANLTGKLADKGWEQRVTTVSMGLMVLSWICFWLGGMYLGWFLLGMLLINIALPGIHIINQTVIFRLGVEARSRLNAVYMTGYFIGGASGSALGTLAWRYGGWAGTCVLGVLLALLTILTLWRDHALAHHKQAIDSK